MKKGCIKRIVCSVLTVALAASAGMLAGCSKTAVVPDVAGMPQEEAAQTVADAGFNMVVSYEHYSKNNPEGYVDKMDTKAGTELEKGGDVKVITSLGEGVQVPNMWVLTGREAANLLSKVGLTPVTVEEFSDEVAEGDIITYTDSGQTLPLGAEVTITVSKGPEK